MTESLNRSCPTLENNGIITRRDGLGAVVSRTEIAYLRELQPEYRHTPDLTGNGSYKPYFFKSQIIVKMNALIEEFLRKLDHSYKYTTECERDLIEADLETIYNSGKTNGIEFAQRWIPVEEKLPEKKNHGFSDKVLTKDRFGNVKIERYDYEFNQFNEIRYDSKETGDGQVSHWRPI